MKAPDPRAVAAPDSARDTVSALDRGLTLLQCFGDDRRVLSPTELARLSGIPRPSVIRLAATLVQHRWLRQEAGSDGSAEGYSLGAGVVSLAQAFLSGLDVRAAARPLMQALAERTGGSVYLAIRDGMEMVLVEACRPRASMLTARLDVGSRAPLPNSALGRAYLGALTPAVRSDLLTTAMAHLATSREPTLLDGLARSLAEHARCGWCLSVGEFHAEINSAAVALTDARGDLLVLNCGGAAFAFSAERLRAEVGPALVTLARALADEIGGRAVLPDGQDVQDARDAQGAKGEPEAATVAVNSGAPP